MLRAEESLKKAFHEYDVAEFLEEHGGMDTSDVPASASKDRFSRSFEVAVRFTGPMSDEEGLALLAFPSRDAFVEFQDDYTIRTNNRSVEILKVLKEDTISDISDLALPPKES
jgi:hypothetical protein